MRRRTMECLERNSKYGEGGGEIMQVNKLFYFKVLINGLAKVCTRSTGLQNFSEVHRCRFKKCIMV